MIALIASLGMAQLLVRQLDDELVSLLKLQAASHGRSAEEEHRLILREALTSVPAKSGKLSFSEYLVADPLADAEIPEISRHHSSERAIEL